METIEEKKQYVEQVQTRIKIIRAESKVLSASIVRMFLQRKKLSDEKRQLKAAIKTLNAQIKAAQDLAA